MGSCISKCKPKKKSKEDECRHVHDKLVISQDPPVIPLDCSRMPSDKPLSDKPLSPAPSTSSTASFSSFSCSNSKYAMASSISSSSSSLSSSSSYYSSAVLRDRSFSNDFLWSCAKENPHAVDLKEKISAEKAVQFPNKIHCRNLYPSPTAVSSPSVTKTKQIVQEKATGSTPKKRGRASSPTLVRQKSFRREQSFVSSTPNRGLRSPSPSRRFNGESNRIFPVKESCVRKPVVSKGNTVNSTPKWESFRATIPSPNRELAISRDHVLRRNDGLPQHIGSRIDGGGDGKETDIVMEDINNPLIALDCFIFL